MLAKNSVVKIQNLIVNHESRPVKSNPALWLKIRKRTGDSATLEVVDTKKRMMVMIKLQRMIKIQLVKMLMF